LLGKYSFPNVAVNGEQETLGQQLVSELSCVRYKFNAHGGFVVESKKDLKARGIPSPNIADALCLTEYFSNSATRVFTEPGIPDEFMSKYRDVSTNPTHDWMGM
jgi:hypothetical protein